MRNIAVITAKGNSRRVPHKNRRDFGGKPLFLYTMDYVYRAREFFDNIIFSTDDVEKFKEHKRYPFKVRIRNLMLTDLLKHEWSMIDALLSTGKPCVYDWVVLFQPTNPIRSIKTMFRLHDELSSASEYELLRTFYYDENLKCRDMVGQDRNSTDQPRIYSGNIFAARAGWLLGGMEHEPREKLMEVSKFQGYNLNTEEDFKILEAMGGL